MKLDLKFFFIAVLDYALELLFSLSSNFKNLF